MSKYDNSDVSINNKGLFDGQKEAESMKLYLENLKLMGELSASAEKITVKVKDTNGVEKDKELEIKSLVPRESEFEGTRKICIVELNKMGEDELRQYMAKYEADSVWELSAKMANFLIDQQRKANTLKKLKGWLPKP